MNFKSIKTKVLVPVLNVFLIGMAIIAAFTTLMITKQVNNDVQEICYAKVDKMERYCQGRLDQWESQVEINAKTDEVRNAILTGNSSMLKNYISEIKDICKETVAFTVIDLNGRFQTNTGITGSVAQEEYFKRAMKGQTVISDPVISKATGNPAIIAVSPVKKNGVIIGAFAQTISMEEFSKQINKEKFAKTGYAFIMNKEATVIAHPDAKSILKVNFLQNQEKTITEFAKKAIAGERGFYRSIKHNNINKVLSFGPIGSTGWSMVLIAPRNEVYGDIDSYAVVSSLLSLIIIIAICFVIIFNISQIIKPINKMVKTTEEVSGGNLTVAAEVKGRDEMAQMAQSLNKMVERLRHMLTAILDSSSMVSSAAEQTSAITQQIASSSENQSLASEHTFSSMEQLDASIQDISMNIQEVTANVSSVIVLISEIDKLTDEITKSAGEVTAQSQNSITAAETGKISVEKTKNGMDEINKAVGDLVIAIRGLGKSAIDIGEIVDVIDDIAEQTNLLALNAAIEAARAGEHGKGFAVVAGAVRSLAEKSGEATKEITKLIRGIQEEVGAAVDTAKNGAQQVEIGVQLAKETESALGQIKYAVEETARQVKNVEMVIESQEKMIKEVSKAAYNVNDLANTIAAAIEEQTAASAEVVLAVKNMNESASQIAGGTNEIASSNDSLAKEASNLLKAVSEFKLS
ncbi:MAG: methyl-accepting chemotaxis protein [Deltaproteobacteria bacterium]